MVHAVRDRLGVRATSALAAAVAVAVVLVVAGVSMVFVLQRTLTAGVEEAAAEQARQLGTRIEANFSGTGNAKTNAIEATGERTDIVQVVTAYGDPTGAPDWMVGSNGTQTDVQVIGSSVPLYGQPRIVPWLLAPDETRTQYDVEIRLADGTVESALVVGEGFRTNGRPITVLAAQETGSVANAVDTVQWLLVLGIPILVLVTGYVTYLFAGSALRPVERMRSRVAGMGERDLARRVPEPVANDEVGRLARTMNQMLGRIEESQATQRRFVADASHELRSPLATVSTGLELLGSAMPEGSADRSTVQTLRGETARITGLVEALLFLARADERGIAPRSEEVDLDEIVDAERTRPSAESAVAVRVTTEPVRVLGDRGQLVRVVRNLVDNARRHASSAVAISVRAGDGVAVVDVDDDGNGVPEADRQRVFERFVRLDEARARGDGGSGLGLSIVSELVAAHGGTIAVLESEELGGARFRVSLPIVDAPGPDAGAEADEPAATGLAATGPATGPAATGLVATGPAAGPAAGSADDRPSGPLRRTDAVPAGAGSRPVMGGRPPAGGPDGTRRGDGGPGAPAGAPGGRPGMMSAPGSPGVTDRDTGTTGDPPARPVTAETGPTGPDAEDRVPDPQAQRRPDRPDPPTGPLPIRPNTVGSPYDENATRPIPVFAGDGGATRPTRSGTAVAARDGRTPADTRTGRPAPRPPQPRGPRDARR